MNEPAVSLWKGQLPLRIFLLSPSWTYLVINWTNSFWGVAGTLTI